MHYEQLQFEYLPNEILFKIFEYFDAQDLLKYFYNLNSHLNILLQSLSNLSLTLHALQSTQISSYDYLTPYITVLIINDKFQVDLNCFSKLRRLVLLKPTDELLKQLDVNSLPNLEHLYIRLNNRIEDNCNEIFPTGFPHLKSCCIYKTGLLTIGLSWTQMLSLHTLKISDIDYSIYQSILSSCPNLYLFKFTRLISNNQSTITPTQHINLKKLILVIPWFEELVENDEINMYILSVPNLEQLTIHRTNESRSINGFYLKFHWYKRLIQMYLTKLYRFNYYFHVLESKDTQPFLTEILLKQIQEHFHYLHRYLNQCRFIIDM